MKQEPRERPDRFIDRKGHGYEETPPTPNVYRPNLN
jgi:hypothetical protein